MKSFEIETGDMYTYPNRASLMFLSDIATNAFYTCTHCNPIFLIVDQTPLSSHPQDYLIWQADKQATRDTEARAKLYIY